MEKIKLQKKVNASPAAIWTVLLEDEYYRDWTSVFSEGSYYKGDWSEGSKILFLGPDGGGLVSRIKRHVPEKLVTIEHLGFVKDNKEVYEGEEVEKWKGVLEEYEVTSENKESLLTIRQDMPEEHKAEFEVMWEKALDRLNTLAENHQNQKA